MKMNRRSFINRSLLLLGLSVADPLRFVDTLQAIRREPKSWKDKILELYPSGDAPFLSLSKSSELSQEPSFKWWEEDLK